MPQGLFLCSTLKKLPDEVLKSFNGFSDEVLAEVTAKDPMSKKVYASYSELLKMIRDWYQISEMAYLGQVIASSKD